MITDSWLIAAIDHRISTAFIFFVLLFLLGNGRRQAGYQGRMVLSLAVMCAVSWVIRYIIECHLSALPLQGIGYSLHVLTMTVLYLLCYALCYRASSVEQVYVTTVALTIYKMAWNIFKVAAYAADMAGILPFWTSYSIFGSIISYVVYIVTCVVMSKLYHNLVPNPPFDVPNSPIVTFGVICLLCQIILEFCGHVFSSAPSTAFLYYLSAFMYTLTSFIALSSIAQVVHYRREYEDMQNFINNKMQYYRMSRDGITSLQIKCHDLKHQIAAIRSETGRHDLDRHINRLEDCIIEYGTLVECGNETLNTVLTEKNILCSTCGIKFSYLIDGSRFDFMSEMDIYSLFGNALDNALESCRKVSAPEQRFISLKASSHGNMVVLHVENNFETPPTMVDGMPVTTKDGIGHGFGLRSIQQIAEKYGGIASVQVEQHIFKLTVLMKPVQD